MQMFTTCTPSEMSKTQFMDKFSDIFEHSAWIAEAAFDAGITAEHNQIEHFHQLVCAILATANHQAKLDLINAHPDLAGKAALAGQLTNSSSAEQTNAGISDCSPTEFALFKQLNSAYQTKFHFPFIMAVKNSNKLKILAAFQQRINNQPEREFLQALLEINKIARFRLADL